MIIDDPVFSLQDPTNIFQTTSKALRKTTPKIVHYKVRPPHTAILDSLGPPTTPCNLRICKWPRGWRWRSFRGCRFWKSNIQWLRPSYPELSRSCAGHLRAVPNGSEARSVGSPVVWRICLNFFIDCPKRWRYCGETLCNSSFVYTWTFNVWPSICCITVFPFFFQNHTKLHNTHIHTQ